MTLQDEIRAELMHALFYARGTATEGLVTSICEADYSDANDPSGAHAGVSSLYALRKLALGEVLLERDCLALQDIPTKLGALKRAIETKKETLEITDAERKARVKVVKKVRKVVEAHREALSQIAQQMDAFMQQVANKS